MDEPVLIVGAGISGLSTAYYLAKHGLPVRLVEKERRLGGVIRTDLVDGCVLESGPDSFVSFKKEAFELCRELGLNGEIVGSNDRRRVTYVVRKGQLVPLPEGLQFVVPTRFWPIISSSLLSWRAKLSFLTDAFRWRSSKDQDESVTEFICRHFHHEVLDYLVEPLLAGIYGGSPEILSATRVLPGLVELERRYGSVVRGALKVQRPPSSAARAGGKSLFLTLRSGLHSLIHQLVKAAGPKLQVIHGEVKSIRRAGQGYLLRVEGEQLWTRQLVVAVPAVVAAQLLEPVDTVLSRELAGIPYSSSITVSLLFDQEAIPRLEGFGFLVPAVERKYLTACTYLHVKFPPKIRPGLVGVRCFLLSSDGELMNCPDEQLVNLCLAELAVLAGIEAKPRHYRVARWPAAMAQYTVGHDERLCRIQERLRELPGLHLVGNAYVGIGISDCIRTAQKAAESITGQPVLQ